MQLGVAVKILQVLPVEVEDEGLLLVAKLVPHRGIGERGHFSFAGT